MAIQISYPTATNVTLSDRLLGTQYDPETGSAITKNFSIGSVVNLGSSYKSYVAKIVQSGEAAPTVTIMQNTIGNISFEYASTGLYYAVSEGLFTGDKTIVNITPGFAYESFDAPYIAYALLGTTNRISISSFNGIVQSNNILGEAFSTVIEIRVYN